MPRLPKHRAVVACLIAGPALAALAQDEASSTEPQPQASPFRILFDEIDRLHAVIDAMRIYPQ